MTAAIFWTAATVMALLTTAVFVVPLFWFASTSSAHTLTRRRIVTAAASALFVPIATLGLYSALGSPQLIETSDAVQRPGALPVGHPPASNDGMPTKAGDLGAAVSRLEARLKAAPNDPDGWRLLAQAYSFAGRREEAAAATARANTSGGSTTQGAERSTTQLSAATQANPLELKAAAQDARRKRDFAGATRAFASLAELGALDADLWADYADAHAAQVGRLDETSAGFIAKALQLRPTHTKALWLLGSYQVQRNDYRAALSTWQSLATQLPPESSDHKIIVANIAEARAALAAGTLVASTMATNSVAVRGSVTVAAQLLARVEANSVLFVIAKAVDSPGPPLAVLRLPAARGVTTFLLDDSNAMIPERRLSKFNKVVVEARISRSGDALPQSGDLRGASVAMDPRTSGPLQLVINESIS